MIVKWSIGIGFRGADRAGEWEVDDNTSDDELDEMLEVEVGNCLDAWWDRQDAPTDKAEEA